VNSPDDDEPMTLDAACKAVFNNAIGPDTLRAEADRGRLVLEKIGRRYFVTRAAIREMRRKCQVDAPQKGQGSGSSLPASEPGAKTTPQSGSSGTDRLSIARAAALKTFSALSEPSKTTSRKSTNRQSATVIPLKS
jgi:hypothetical protein